MKLICLDTSSMYLKYGVKISEYYDLSTLKTISAINFQDC